MSELYNYKCARESVGACASLMLLTTYLSTCVLAVKELRHKGTLRYKGTLRHKGTLQFSWPLFARAPI